MSVRTLVKPGFALPPVLGELLPSFLTPATSSVELCKGEHLFLRRQKPRQMYFVVSGEIVLERVGERGDSVVLQRVRQGFVAEASLQTSRYHCDAVVTSPGQAIAVPIEPLTAALTSDSDFALRWIGMLNAEVRRLRAQCERMSLKGVGARLLHLIETEGAEGRLPIDSGLKTLAAELSVTHEALYRAVAVLEKAGTVAREKGFICVVGSPRSSAPA